MPISSSDTWEPISLGSTCAVKFQTSRRMYVAKYGQRGDLHECRRTLLTPDRGSANYERHIFDWAITPFSAVGHCIETGFDHGFDREDLIVSNGEAVNIRLGSRHPHDFHASDPEAGLTDADIDAQYEHVRGKFDHLAGRFMALNQRPGRFLYVFEGFPYFQHVATVLAWMASGSPQHDYRMLLVGYDDEADQPYEALTDRLSWRKIPRAVNKPASQQWEGEDALWDEALGPWRLWPQNERMVRCIDAPDAAPAKPGLFKRLAGVFGG